MPETAEEISRKPEIRKELQRTTGEKRSETIKARGRDKLWSLYRHLSLLVALPPIFSSAPR
jgi:hypothetical protein